jgi:hypothetical protein
MHKGEPRDRRNPALPIEPWRFVAGVDKLSAGDAKVAQAEEAHVMAHLVEKRFLERANSALMLGLVCGGLAICAFGAIAFDLTRWFAE